MSQLKKLEREQNFNASEFNKNFEQEENQKEQEEQGENQKNQEEQGGKKQKNQKIPKNLSYTDDLGINIKNLFFEILELLMNKENPIPYIMENEKRQFYFAIMILLIGGLLLFWSNLMINENK
jgi:hypothetical protein